MKYEVKSISELLEHPYHKVAEMSYVFEKHNGTQSEEQTSIVTSNRDGVAVLLYDADKDKVVLIKQFRLGAALADPEQAQQLELVMGGVEEGEILEAAALRECQEEAGIRPKRLIRSASHWVGAGYCLDRIYIYIGYCDVPVADSVHGLDEEGEDIKTVTMSPEEAYRILLSTDNNTTGHAAAMIAIQQLIINKGLDV